MTTSPDNSQKRTSRTSESDGRAVVTLSPPVASAVKRMGTQLDVSTVEVVRRGLILLDLMLSLPEDEELVVRSKKTQQLERLRFAWDML